MERITVFDGEFWAHKNFPPVKDDTVDEFVDCVKELAARLAAYEDTGLGPEEIERILNSYGRGMTLRTENAQRLEIIKEIPIDRLRELAQADKADEIGKYRFYYCESEDEYLIGARLDTFYYARWDGSSFTWSMSRYLPWGKHVVAPETAWKEYTYPSEPKEIGMSEWFKGFLGKLTREAAEAALEEMEAEHDT